MDFRAKARDIIKTIIENMHEWRKVVLALSCLVVFITTYILILPAFTLDKEEAAEQGGIDVPAVEQTVDGDKESAEPAKETPNTDSAEKKDATKASAAKSAKDSASAAKGSASTDITLQNDESDDFVVAVEGKGEVLSEDMSVAVREIAESDKDQKEEYDSLYNDALEAVQKAQTEEGLEKPSDFAFAKFYDISLMDGDEAVEPGEEVDVKISFGKALQKELAKQAGTIDPKRVHIVHFAVDEETGEASPEVLDPETTDITVENNKITDAAFTADSFSVFAVVYTVDFHYEINGKMYDFSIPGGGFVSLEHVVEVLGIASADVNSENGAENAENGAENGDDFVREVPGVNLSDENGTAYEEAINLNEVEVSEATKKFVADVESVEFSSPELLWVGKVDEAATVGGLKEANGLEVEYSAELTEEQIAEINAQTVEAGDWALISILPFTSEETLTVTMKNGDQFVVRVTDAQPADTDTNWYGHYNDCERGNTNRFVIWGVGSDGKNYVLKTDGTTEEFNPESIDTLGAEYLWTIEYGWNQGWDSGLQQYDYRYYIRPANDPTKCLALNNGYISGENLVQSESSGTHLYAPYSRHKNQQNNNYTNNNSGWIVEGWGWTRLNLGNSSHQFEGHQQYCSNINISRVQTPLTYDIIVRTDNYDRGAVSGKDKGGTNRQAAESFIATTENTYSVTKRNGNAIEAEPQTLQWMFDYWDLDGQTLYWDRYQRRIVFEENANTEIYTNLNGDRASVINAYSLPVSFNGSTLTAHFKRNPDYVVPDDDKDGRPIDATIAEWLENLLDADFPLNKSATQKTAEVYDYENRIYRVDITASSNLYALDKNVKLGFILDVSGSMKFPSQLDMVSNTNNTQTTTVKTNQLKLELNKINDSKSNRENWLNRNKTYYMIADVTGTATVNRIFYDWSSNKWKFVDSSKDNSEATEISTSTPFHSSGDTGGNYPIYMAGDPIKAEDLSSPEGSLLTSMGLGVGDPKPRAFYLQKSMRETTATLQQIMDKVSVANNPNDASEVLIAWNTFCKNVNGSDHTFKAPANVEFSYTYSGGTSTDRALNDALSFGWGHGSDASRFAVLITDGAPQRDGSYVPDDTVGGYADTLKANGTPSNTADDITLITLGLSMGDVHRGEVLLYDIASKDKENVPYYYEAESGNELELALAEVIRLAMANAITEGNVTDTVNEAFYPVDKNTGLPLENGYVINLNGEQIAFSESTLTYEQRNAGYGVISETNGTYSVTWTGQEFTWEGWHGTIYEKAKEDFLGGNAVRTNDPDHPAVVTSTGYKLHSGDTAIPFKDSIKTAGTKSLETPRVNVNELQIEGNNTEWTVYLGTSVDPLEQIKELYKNIKVQQVITNGTDTDHDSFKDKEKWDWNSLDENFPLYYDLTESASDDRENETYGQQEFFYLSDLIKKLNGGNDIDWTRLIELSEKTGDQNTGITFPYNLYGQDNPGWITIKLEKDHSVDSHATDQVGTPVETYTLTAFFSPMYDHTPVGLGGDGLYPYHTGNYGLGTYGNAPGTEDVSNEHKINVFAKKLSITKVDQANTAIKNSDAEFKLYRKAQTDETPLGSEDVPAGLPAGSYVLADTLTVASDGKAKTNIDISRLPNDEPYYLVETKTPAGYISLSGALEVKAEINNEVWTKVADSTQPLTSSTKWDPYVLSNWNHDATVIVSGDGELASYAVREGNIIYDQTQDGASYMIRNNAGVELPATGGPGTTALYLLGIMLTVFAGTGLVMRKRRRDVA